MKATVYQTHTFQDATNVLHNWIAHRLIKDKLQPGQIEVKLMEQGIDQASATRMVDEVVDEWRAKHAKRKKVILYAGVFVFIAGAVVSVSFGFGKYWWLLLLGFSLLLWSVRKINQK